MNSLMIEPLKYQVLSKVSVYVTNYNAKGVI